MKKKFLYSFLLFVLHQTCATAQGTISSTCQCKEIASAVEYKIAPSLKSLGTKPASEIDKRKIVTKPDKNYIPPIVIPEPKPANQVPDPNTPLKLLENVRLTYVGLTSQECDNLLSKLSISISNVVFKQGQVVKNSSGTNESAFELTFTVTATNNSVRNLELNQSVGRFADSNFSFVLSAGTTKTYPVIFRKICDTPPSAVFNSGDVSFLYRLFLNRGGCTGTGALQAEKTTTVTVKNPTKSLYPYQAEKCPYYIID